MTDLSIIVLICDNDFQHLEKSLSCIKKYIKVNYQVVVVDNREKNNNQLPEGNYEIVKPSENTYCFEGRRIGLEKAIGKYIWYIDVDDEICDYLLPEDISNNEIDFYQMYTKTEKGGLTPGSFHGCLLAFPDGVWSRLYRADFLREIYTPIKRNLKIVQFEDLALKELIFQKNPKVEYIDKVMYFYITERSVNFSEKPDINKYKNSQIGEEDLEYLYTFIKDGDIKIKMLKNVRENLIKTIEGRLK